MSLLASYAVALLGGALIGLAATLVYVLHGRIAGISGLFGGVFLPQSDARDLRLVFVVGLAVAGLVMSRLLPDAFPTTGGSSIAVVAVAGLLVGYGTRLGNGCTSGHGVCGISRLSIRSIVATVTFMAAGMVTVLVVSRLFGGAR